MAMPTPVWTPNEPPHPAVGDDWPRGYALLLAHLTSHGREQFRAELAAAVVEGTEQDVIERWWVALQARHDEGYEQHLGEGLYADAGKPQSAADLRRQVNEMRGWWNLMVLRHDPAARVAFDQPTPPPSERRYQTTAELRAEVEALAAR